MNAVARARLREHGAHLADYAAYRAGPAAAAGAVAAALEAALESARRRSAPPSVSERGLLFAELRRVCLADGGCTGAYRPGGGPGLPDAELMERAWALADPLGVEALLLMFRHELTLADLAHLLALPPGEAHRLILRTQDFIETLVSALDADARGRPVCALAGPLVATALGDGTAEARSELLDHVLGCAACTRPINIHYTVPQMIDHRPVAPLGAAERDRILAMLESRIRDHARDTDPVATMPLAAPVPVEPLDTVPPRRTTPSETPETLEVRLPAVPRPGGMDTPLYNALATRAWARGVLSPTDPAPHPPPRPAADAGTPPGPPRRAGSRLAEALWTAGWRTRRTAARVAIMLVAGTAGMITGLQVVGPAQDPPGLTAASGSQAPAGRLVLPPAVELDAFGRGSIRLTLTGDPVSRHVVAPGLRVTPAVVTGGEGELVVLRIRALRVRRWCGDPSPAETTLTLQGPADSASTRVRWHTC
ncbi:hypothetical protein [Thermoactinospora rubra]|uniref:hypothetical protein n=1 Tax=Thermoactinospora rubra TaxID=1088767 RepID=UPI001181097C|nr:hypothetical protein [Thermoactinospora rubra]